jgi:hypothetical protein
MHRENSFTNSRIESDLMRKVLLLIYLVGIACASRAQVDRTSWTNVSGLQTGQKIQIVEMNSKKHSGTFVTVSNTAIAYQDAAGEQTIQKQDVRSVKLMENKHRLRNALLIGGLGAGVGAGIGAAEFHSCTSQSFCIQPAGKGAYAGIGAAVGFAGGAVVGALTPSHTTIYRVNSQ